MRVLRQQRRNAVQRRARVQKRAAWCCSGRRGAAHQVPGVAERVWIARAECVRFGHRDHCLGGWFERSSSTDPSLCSGAPVYQKGGGDGLVLLYRYRYEREHSVRVNHYGEQQ